MAHSPGWRAQRHLHAAFLRFDARVVPTSASASSEIRFFVHQNGGVLPINQFISIQGDGCFCRNLFACKIIEFPAGECER